MASFYNCKRGYYGRTVLCSGSSTQTILVQIGRLYSNSSLSKVRSDYSSLGRISSSQITLSLFFLLGYKLCPYPLIQLGSKVMDLGAIPDHLSLESLGEAISQGSITLSGNQLISPDKIFLEANFRLIQDPLVHCLIITLELQWLILEGQVSLLFLFQSLLYPL